MQRTFIHACMHVQVQVHAVALLQPQATYLLPWALLAIAVFIVPSLFCLLAHPASYLEHNNLYPMPARL